MNKLLATAIVGALTFGLFSAPATAADYDSSAHMLRDAAPGAAGSYPDEGAILGSKLIYRAGTATTGHEPWISDGTTAGTRMLRNIRPGASDSDATEFVAFKGRVYFTANDGSHGAELWSTDGTAGGTRQVKDVQSGGAGSNPYQLVVAGNTLFFTATTQDHGQELWKFNGTAPTLVTEIGLGATDAGIMSLTAWGTRVAFRALDVNGAEPWVSDGTLAGTHPVGNLSAGGAGSFPDTFTPIGNRLYFAAQPSGSARTLFSTDGIANSFQVSTANFADPRSLTALGSRLIFTAENPTTGRELWTTDGNDSGTVQIKDIQPGPGSAEPQSLASFNGRIYFGASDAPGHSRLWSTDGTLAHTSRVTTDTGGQESSPARTKVVAGTLFFAARRGTDTTGIELWQSNGTAASTRLVKDIAPGATSSLPLPMAAISNTLFFSADDLVHGHELWAYTARVSATKGYGRTVSKKTATKRRIRVTVKVRATGTTPIGTVVLKKGSRIIGKGTLKSGATRIRITKKLGKGTHKIRAYYSGSVRARTSHSGTIRIRLK